LVADGNIYCWGESYYAFSGNGYRLANPTEIAKPALFDNKRFTKVSVGVSTICAIADSQAYCWGAGENGQIGNGAAQRVDTPTPVSTLGLLSGKTVTDISVGGNHACAVADGKAYCWGNNSNGQLGNGTTTSSNSPVQVSSAGVLAGKTINSISAGSNHTCAIASSTAYCWGYNQQGQLGNGTTTSSNSPVQVSSAGVLAGKTINSISTSSNHTCAIASGAAYCWGYNQQGQLGNGTTTSSNSPVQVSSAGVLAGKTFNSISARSNHTCAIAGSAAYCWGYNQSGQLGNGTQTDSSTPVTVLTSGALQSKSLSQITTGSEHSCAATLTEAFCWGENSSNQLGDNTKERNLTPSKVVTTSSASNAVDIHSISYDENSASLKFIADNQSFSHYLSFDSNLGSKKLPTAESLGVLSGKVISKAVQGYGFACYLVEGRVYCAGQNASGQLGNGTQAVSDIPVEIDMAGALKGLSITDISAGYAHSCVNASGKVFCWGSNSQGQLGVSDVRDSSNGFKTIASLSPIAVDTTGDLTKDMAVQYLTTSLYSTCIVAAGQPYCWGSFVDGFHKNSNAYGKPLPLAEYGELAGKKVAKIAIPHFQTYSYEQSTVCAVTLDGEGFCWGSPTYNSGSSKVTTPTKIDTSEIGQRRITEIEVGRNFGCALALGQMYCWGANANGQLGTGDNVSLSRPKLVSQDGLLKDKEVISMYLTGGRTYFTYRAASGTLLQQRKTLVDAELKVIADAKAAAELELLNARNQAKRDAETAAKERLLYAEGTQITTSSTRAVSLAMTGVTNEKVDGALKLHSLEIPPTFGGRTATTIRVGGTFSCAIAGGTPYCWGNNSSGQLGNGTTTSSAVPSPVELPEKIKGKAISTLSVGGSTACVVVDGEAYCWGNNSIGQLGVSGISISMIPVAVDTSGVLKNLKISSIEVGETHTCAIATGKAFCWGYNQSSQLGSAKAKKEAVFIPTEVDTDGALKNKTITGIAAGPSHTCVSATNELFCWGEDYNGQLGGGVYGGIQEIKDAKPILFSKSVVKQISRIEAASSSTCVIADSELYCWGYNASGRFNSSSFDSNIKPVKVEMVGQLLGREIQEVGIGSNYLCVLASSAPLCWGANQQGQLGNGSIISSTIPVKVSSNVVKAGSTLDLGVANSTSCAIAEGRVYCWGSSYQLQGGRITPQIASAPLVVGVDSSELQFKSITNLESRENYSSAYYFVADGNPYVVSPRVDKNLNPLTFPTRQTNLGGIQDKEITKFIYRSNFQCYLVSKEMYCQGDNSLGQLGSGSMQYSDLPLKVEASGVLKGKKIDDFVMGYGHACVLSDGQVFCWGSNEAGQLGISNEKDAFGAFKTKFVNQPVAVDTSGVLKGKKITDIEASNQSTCVVADGEIFCWGVLHSSFVDPKKPNERTVGTPQELRTKGELAEKLITRVVMPPQLYASSQICAIAENRAYCWGYDGTTGSLSTERWIPHVVGDKFLISRPVSDLVISSSHACLISMGEVFCWGQNSSGQLGIGTITYQQMPVLMDGGEVLKNREVFALALSSTTSIVAHRALTADRAKTFSDLKSQIEKQVAEEDRLKAKAAAEELAKAAAEELAKAKAAAEELAKAKAAAEERARAQAAAEELAKAQAAARKLAAAIVARKNELESIRQEILQSAEDTAGSANAYKLNCEESIKDLTAVQRLAIARTSISISCDKYSQIPFELKNLAKDLTSISFEEVTIENYESKLSSLDVFRKQVVAIEESNAFFSREISRISNDFEELIYLEGLYADSAVKEYRKWITLDARVQKLPSVTKKAIVEKTTYRSALSKVLVVEAVQRSFETYRSSLAGITTTLELSNASSQLATLIAKLDMAESLYLDIASIEKLIPSFVCSKGGSLSPLPKNGKCLVGAKKTSTK
jgi:alpha-tubulin suppressor-like RCC1 family protein